MLSQVGAMEKGDEALSVLPDPGRKASGQASVREEQRGRYQDVLQQEIIQERPARTRHHRYGFIPQKARTLARAHAKENHRNAFDYVAKKKRVNLFGQKFGLVQFFR
jgi:hypothetical protein